MGLAAVSLARAHSPAPSTELEGISGEAGISNQVTLLNKIRICLYLKGERESRMDTE